jgi:Spy/CpxP family protein refolding chaperone
MQSRNVWSGCALVALLLFGAATAQPPDKKDGPAQPGKRAGRDGKGGRGARAGAGGFGASLTFLAGQKSVQEEVKMTTEQVGKVKELADKQRQDFAGLRNLSREERQKKAEERTQAEAKALADVLKPDQFKRLKQISWQQQGTRALSNAEVADALGLSAEQKDKVKSIREDSRKEMRDLVRGGNREEARKKLEELRKADDEKVTAVLTAEQKTKLKELTGEPFKGEIQRPQFGGFGGRRGRPAADTEPPKKDPAKPTEPAPKTEPKKN